MLRYEHSVEMKRCPWQRRIEVFSPKVMRRISLYSRDAHDAWLLLESNPRVDSFCERPAYLKGEAGPILPFGSVRIAKKHSGLLSLRGSTPNHCRSLCTASRFASRRDRT